MMRAPGFRQISTRAPTSITRFSGSLKNAATPLKRRT
jgi:hypothetical protein